MNRLVIVAYVYIANIRGLVHSIGMLRKTIRLILHIDVNFILILLLI